MQTKPTREQEFDHPSAEIPELIAVTTFIASNGSSQSLKSQNAEIRAVACDWSHAMKPIQ